MSRRGRGGARASVALLLALGAIGCGDAGRGAGADAADGRHGAQEPARPNLIVIVGDDQDYRDFGFMGSDAVRTPTLDRLAAEGTVFTTAYSTASVCRPSLRTLLTGLHHYVYELYGQHRVRAGMPLGDAGALISTLVTLPRALAAVGYRSFQAGKHWEGAFRKAGFTDGMVADDSELARLDAMSFGRASIQPVVDFLDDVGDAPFLLWFVPLLPHVPHDAPPEYEAGLDPALPPTTRRYYANIARFDAVVAELLRQLDARGQLDGAIVVYLADNGWRPAPDAPQHNRDLLGDPHGKASLYEPGFRTPLIVHAPGRVPAGVRDDLVSTEDLFPTLLGYAGAPLPPGRSGIDLRPALERGEPVARDAIVGSLPPTARVPAGGLFARTAQWHYLRFEGGAEELYRVAEDPHEQRDVLGAHPHVARDLRARVVAWAEAARREARALAARGDGPGR